MALTIFHQMASNFRSNYFGIISTTKPKFLQSVIQKGRTNYKGLQTQNWVSSFQQTILNLDYMEDLETNFSNMVKVKKLEKKLAAMLIEFENGGLNSLELLELVDDIERLGLGYRFRTDITRVLNKLASISYETEENNLHTVSLKFRLLREHGCSVSQDFLERFKGSQGDLIQTDVKTLLSIYEASYLALKSESDMHQVKLFATDNMQKLSGNVDKVMDDHINRALNIPLYRRMERLQARWYIDAYGRRKDVNHLLLELSILDFNMVQSANKKDLQQVSKWWTNAKLEKNFCFSWDRLMECFFWSVGLVFEPQYYSCRVMLTKVCALITIFSDIYEGYESLDNLKVLTNAVKRWDTSTLENMPKRLQLGLLVLYNTINEMCIETLVTKRKNIIPVLAKAWGELCEALLVKARWTQTKYMPTSDAYLDNAWRSSSGVVILTHAYLSMNQDDKTDVNESLEKCHDLFKWSSMIFQLYKDLVTSSEEIKRRRRTNAISCYMHQNGVCEEVVRRYIKKTLINKAWMKLIEARVACSKDFAYPFIDVAINLARVSCCVYQYGDENGAIDAKAKDRVSSMIIEPIPNIREKGQQYSL